MAWTQSDIDTLKAAIASGVRTVKYAGPPSREVTYASTTEMFQALGQMENEVNSPRTYRLAKTKRGFRE